MDAIVKRFKATDADTGVQQKAIWVAPNAKERPPDERMIPISSERIDRYGDIVRAKGGRYEDYKDNARVLLSHGMTGGIAGHHPLPMVATATGLYRIKSKSGFPGIAADWRWATTTELARDVAGLWNEEQLDATSISFMPDEEHTDYIDADGKKVKDEWDAAGFDFKQWDMIEFSIVGIPANPDAVRHILKRCCPETRDYFDVERIVAARRYFDLGGEGRAKLLEKAKAGKARGGPVADIAWGCEGGPEKFVTTDDSQLDTWATDAATPIAKIPADGKNTTAVLANADVVDRGVISYAAAHPNGTPKAPEDEAWDGPKERAAADVDDLKVMSAWVDSEKDDTKGAYKLHHHKAEGQHAVVWRGVSAAMAALLGGRGGVNIPDGDRQGVYNHLKKHYKEFDKPAPEFREYGSDELAEMFGADVLLPSGFRFLTDDEIHEELCGGPPKPRLGISEAAKVLKDTALMECGECGRLVGYYAPAERFLNHFPPQGGHDVCPGGEPADDGPRYTVKDLIQGVAEANGPQNTATRERLIENLQVKLSAEACARQLCSRLKQLAAHLASEPGAPSADDAPHVRAVLDAFEAFQIAAKAITDAVEPDTEAATPAEPDTGTAEPEAAPTSEGLSPEAQRLIVDGLTPLVDELARRLPRQDAE